MVSWSNYGAEDSGSDADIAAYDDAFMSRLAIPLLSTAGSMAQLVMIAGTWGVGEVSTQQSTGKPAG